MKLGLARRAIKKQAEVIDNALQILSKQHPGNEDEIDNIRERLHDKDVNIQLAAFLESKEMAEKLGGKK